MKYSTSSIRSKIWLCVLVALIGLLIATVSSLYANFKQYQNLSQLQEEYYPLASLGLKLTNTFELQIEEYEDAFITGERSLAVDRVLDKISKSGIESLTDEERRLLEEESRQLRKH